MNMKKAIVLLCICLMIPVVSCAETVITSFYPVWLITLNLTQGVEGITVSNLSESSTGCLHDYTLRNSDMVSLSDADALFINGGGMESFLPVISHAYPDLPVVDASEGISPLFESDTVQIGDIEDGETVNAHFWLDPERAAAMAANLAEGLIRLMPDHEQQFTANLKAYQERLLALEQTIRAELQSLPKREIIIFHEALPYFVQACDLPVIAVVNKEPEDDLSSAQLARIMNVISSETTLPMILKSTETDRAASVLAQETGVPVCELDPVVTGPDNPPLDYYETVMIQNLNTLSEALRSK